MTAIYKTESPCKFALSQNMFLCIDILVLNLSLMQGSLSLQKHTEKIEPLHAYTVLMA